MVKQKNQILEITKKMKATFVLLLVALFVVIFISATTVPAQTPCPEKDLDCLLEKARKQKTNTTNNKTKIDTVDALLLMEKSGVKIDGDEVRIPKLNFRLSIKSFDRVRFSSGTHGINKVLFIRLFHDRFDKEPKVVYVVENNKVFNLTLRQEIDRISLKILEDRCETSSNSDPLCRVWRRGRRSPEKPRVITLPPQ